MKISAPGSLMLLGEYAVLHGKSSIVAAINKRIYITIEKTDAHTIIESDAYGKFFLHGNLPPQMVMLRNIISHLIPDLHCHIKIESEFSDKMGFGSSGAIISALVSALLIFDKKIENFDSDFLIYIFDICSTISSKYVGHLSCSDIAASIYGSIVHYDMKNYVKKRFFFPDMQFTTVYSGMKKKTLEVMKIVNNYIEIYPDIYSNIFNLSESITNEAIIALEEKNYNSLGRLFNMYQGIMESIGVTSPLLQSLTYKLRNDAGIYGSKITGAGMGDCVIGLGQLNKENTGLRYHDICELKISKDGVRIES